MKKKIIVGSRGSRLALIQTEIVTEQLKKANPDIEVGVRRIITGGDRNLHLQLDQMDGLGFFVKELEEALLEGRIDLAVHSLKDVPTEIASGLCLAAVTERQDARDVLVSRGERISGLVSGSRIGTGSLRRALQLNMFRSDLVVCGIRGNVDTRISKVSRGEYDGIILAAAALHRLGWEDKITEYLPTEYFLPAAGQGALAIETRAEDSELRGMLAPLNHQPTWQSVTAERAFLLALGGGCRAPIAALGAACGTTLQLEGMVADSKRSRMLRFSETGSSGEPEELGLRLANKLFSMGAGELLTEAGE